MYFLGLICFRAPRSFGTTNNILLNIVYWKTSIISLKSHTLRGIITKICSLLARIFHKKIVENCTGTEILNFVFSSHSKDLFKNGKKTIYPWIFLSLVLKQGEVEN